MRPMKADPLSTTRTESDFGHRVCEEPDGSTCAACAHLWTAHDALGRRFCTATRVVGWSRGWHLPLTGTAAMSRGAVSLAATSSRGSGSGPTELLSLGAGARPMVELGQRPCGVQDAIDPASRWVRPSCTQRVRTAESDNRKVPDSDSNPDQAGSPCKDVP
jgi:hypothetical protein